MVSIVKLIFPYPEPPEYNLKTPDLYFIKAGETGESTSPQRGRLPIFFLRLSQKWNSLLIYFHGNAEDAGSSLSMFAEIGERLKANIAVVEYPKYGVYKGAELSEEQIYKDALEVYDFFVRDAGFRPENVIVFGRSIGTGPATYLAAKRRCRFLILFSPYLNIKKVAMEKTFLAFFTRNIFSNDKYIEEVHDPVYILHGRRDDVISFSHGEALHRMLVRRNIFTKFVAPDEMTHNLFDFENDLMATLQAFNDSILKQKNPFQINPNEQSPRWDFIERFRVSPRRISF